MSDDTTTLTIQHSELGVCHEVPVKDLVRATPALLLSHLQRQGALPPDDPSRPYVMLAEGRTLVPTQSFDAQGVTDRSVITLITRGTGAAPTASKERRVLDFETMRTSFPVGGRTVPAWAAYRSVAAAEAKAPVTDPTQATVYEVDLSFPSPIGWDLMATSFRVRIDAAKPSFPREEPTAHFVSANRPWNPHVRGSDGLVCSGTLWLPSKLIAFYVLDILRVLNFDFGLDPRAQAGHYQPQAVDWWRARHGGRPLSSGGYPTVLSPDVRKAVEDDPFGPIVTSRAG